MSRQALTVDEKIVATGRCAQPAVVGDKGAWIVPTHEARPCRVLSTIGIVGWTLPLLAPIVVSASRWASRSIHSVTAPRAAAEGRFAED
jgi:hypothetical protein